MEKENRGELAKKYFAEGYNCSQAVVLSFADELDVDRKTLSKIASSFGGGMGRLREVCGSVSGMFIVTGLFTGYSGNETGKGKAEHYSHIQELARRFENENRSIVCRELLGLTEKKSTPTPEKRTDEYYKKRPCSELVYSAANILDGYLHELGLL